MMHINEVITELDYELMEYMGKQLLLARQKRKVRQSTIAYSLGLSHSFVCSVEKGRRFVPAKYIPKWCFMVGITPSKLFGMDDVFY